MENDQLYAFANNDASASSFHYDNFSTPFLPSEYFDMSPILAEDASNDEATFHTATENLSFVSDISIGITEITSHQENFSSLNFNHTFLSAPRQLFRSIKSSENTFSHADIPQTIWENLIMIQTPTNSAKFKTWLLL